MKFGAINLPPDSDIPPDAGWGLKLLKILKLVVDDLGIILDGGVKFNEHIDGGTVTVPIVGGVYPVKFHPRARQVSSVWVGRVKPKLSSTAAPTAAVWCDWEMGAGTVDVSNITGLTAGAEYYITFVYLGA